MLALKNDILTNLMASMRAHYPTLECVVTPRGVELGNTITARTDVAVKDVISSLDKTAFKSLIALLEANEIATALQDLHVKHSEQAQQQLCDAYNKRTSFAQCFVSLTQQNTSAKQCLASYQGKLDQQLMVVEAGKTLSKYLPDVSPFLLLQLESKQQQIEQVLDDYDGLTKVLEQVVSDAITEYAKFQAHIAVLRYAVKLPPEIAPYLGIDHQQLHGLLTQLDKAAYQNISELNDTQRASAHYKEQHEIVKQQVNTFGPRIEQIAKRIINKVQTLAEDWQSQASTQISDYVVSQTSEAISSALGSLALKIVLKQQSDKVNGQIAYQASFYYQLDDGSVELAQNCDAEAVSCTAPVENTAVDNVRYNEPAERIELGIYIDALAVEKGADKLRFRYLKQGLKANARVDQSKLKKALIRLGMPNSLSLGDASIQASVDLNDVTLKLPMKVLGLASTDSLSLQILKDGRFVEPTKALTQFINTQVSSHVQRAVKQWVQKLPYIDAQLPYSDFILHASSQDISAVYDAKSKSISGSFIIRATKASQHLGNIKADYELTEQGVRFTRTHIEDELAKNLNDELRAQLTQLLDPQVMQFVEHFAASFHKQQFGVELYLSAEVMECRLNSTLRIEYPLSDVTLLLRDALGTLKAQAQQCAQDKAIELAWQQVPAIDFTQPLHLFGVQFRYLSHERLSETQYTVSIEASVNNASLLIQELPLEYRDGKLSAHLHKAKFSAKDLELYLQQLAAPALDALGEYVRIDKAGVDKGGVYFYATLVDVPYLNDVALGRVFISATEQNLDIALVGAVKHSLTNYINNELDQQLSIKAFGPVSGISANITTTDTFVLGIKAQLQVYDGISVPVQVDLVPFKIHDINVDDTIKNSVLATLNQLAPKQLGVFEFTKTPTVGLVPEHGIYGINMGVKIDLVLFDVRLNRVAFSHKGLVLPEEVGAAIPAAINFGYVVLSKVGVVYNTRKPSLKLIGDITAGDASLANVAKIQSELDLSDMANLKFVLNGNLVVANSLSLLSAHGEVALKEARVHYQAHSNPMFEQIIKAESEGLINGPQKLFSTHSRLSVLSLDLNENDLIVDVENEVIRFKGSEHLAIGRAEFGVLTNTGFENPTAHAEFGLDLAGWDELGAKAKLSLALASLEMNVLGLNVDVLAPSIDTISPRLLLNILSNLLKVDIKALLNTKLDDITVSLLDAQGQVRSMSQGKPQRDDSNGDGTSSSDDENSGGTPNPKPVVPAPTTNPSTTGGGQIGKYAVNNYCAALGNNRYAYQTVHVGYPRFSYSDASRGYELSFNQQAKELLCGSDDTVEPHWYGVYKSNIQLGGQCNQASHLLNYQIGNVQSTYAPSAEKRVFCGQLQREIPKCYASSRFVDDFEDISVDDYKVIEQRHEEIGSKQLEYWGYDDAVTAIESKLIQKAVNKVDNNRECGHIRKITLSYTLDEGIFFDDYEVSAKVDYYPYHAKRDWEQSVKLFYHTTEKTFYALNLCVDPYYLKDLGFKPSTEHVHICDAGMFALPQLAGYDANNLILSNADEYFLVDDAAATFVLTGELPKQQPVKFSFMLADNSYSGTEFLPTQGVSYKKYYVSAVQNQINSEHSFTIAEQDPLYPWFSTDKFRDELIAQYSNNPDIRIWYQDLDSNTLVLTHPAHRGLNITTYWLRKGLKPLTVHIDLRNPYRQNRPLSESEQARLVEVLKGLLPQLSSDELTVSVGRDPQQGLDTLMLYDAKDITVMLSQSSDRVLAKPMNILNNGRKISANLKAMQSCLEKIHVAMSVQQMLQNPGQAYAQFTPQIYPLNLLDLKECRDAQN
ncbi:hypothetical protein AAEU32_03665 [Pseudoalteromonas sp. SSDWG2]|uniref:hypothetical protein n=1 Tax=Pseudoalteromonas sp. SSDWG2 TaxID=3139391 RepID=UPI003BAB3922